MVGSANFEPSLEGEQYWANSYKRERGAYPRGPDERGSQKRACKTRLKEQGNKGVRHRRGKHTTELAFSFVFTAIKYYSGGGP